MDLGDFGAGLMIVGIIGLCAVIGLPITLEFLFEVNDVHNDKDNQEFLKELVYKLIFFLGIPSFILEVVGAILSAIYD